MDRLDLWMVQASIVSLAAFTFFPYWRLLPLGTDIQPNALLLASVVWLAAWRVRMPRTILLLALPAAFGLVLVLSAPLGMPAFRSAGNYVALWLIAFATYGTLRERDWLSPGLLKAVVGAWFVVGLIQVVVDPSFLVAIVNPGARFAVAGRGVVGLATEPAHYAVHCVLLFLLVQHQAARGRLTVFDARVLRLLLAVQVLVFARSALGVLLLAAVVGTGIVLRYRAAPLRLVLVFVGLTVAGVMAVIAAAAAVGIELGRLGNVMLALLSDPLLFFRVDGSANKRLFHVVGPFWALVQNSFLPYGYDAWAEFVSRAPIASDGFFWAMSRRRVMSGYGAAVFELGLVGLLIPAAVTVAVRRSTSSWTHAAIVAAPLHLMMLVTAPVGKPITALLIGYFAAGPPREEGNDDA